MKAWSFAKHYRRSAIFLPLQFSRFRARLFDAAGGKAFPHIDSLNGFGKKAP